MPRCSARRSAAAASSRSSPPARISTRRRRCSSARGCGSSRSGSSTASACSPRCGRASRAWPPRRRRRRSDELWCFNPGARDRGASATPRSTRGCSARERAVRARSRSASAARSARARPRWPRRSAGGSATALDMAVITNDIYTKEDAEFLVRRGALAARARGRRGDRRLPAHGDPRGRLGEPRGGAPSSRTLSRARPAPDRERRRQPGRHLQPRAGRRDDLRHRRGRGREDPAQGRPGDHAVEPPGHQQDRPGAATWAPTSR